MRLENTRTSGSGSTTVLKRGSKGREAGDFSPASAIRFLRTGGQRPVYRSLTAIIAGFCRYPAFARKRNKGSADGVIGTGSTLGLVQFTIVQVDQGLFVKRELFGDFLGLH
jgi:hypothetical protein